MAHATILASEGLALLHMLLDHVLLWLMRIAYTMLFQIREQRLYCSYDSADVDGRWPSIAMPSGVPINADVSVQLKPTAVAQQLDAWSGVWEVLREHDLAVIDSTFKHRWIRSCDREVDLGVVVIDYFDSHIHLFQGFSKLVDNYSVVVHSEVGYWYRNILVTVNGSCSL